MNNIEILEDYIEALRKPKPFKYTNEQKAQAIENLVQENKEKNKEIEKYKMLLAESTANRVMTSLKDSKKSKEDLEMLNEGWKIELEQKDKIIDEMAEYINELDIDEDICTKNVINPQLCNEEYSNCKECIKEYFKKESEKE